MARRKNEIAVNNTFFIITNGQESEFNYFTLLKKKRSVYDVKIKYANKDPYDLVTYASDFSKCANQVWIVFDVDNSHREGRLTKAIKEAEKKGIKWACSNVAFEVWLIMHFKECTKVMTAKDTYKILTNYLKDKGINKDYDKADIKVLEKVFIPNYKMAVSRAKVLWQKRLLEHNHQYGNNKYPEIGEWNPATNVYKLIEALKLSE